MTADDVTLTEAERIVAGRIKHGVGASEDFPGNVCHLVSPIVGFLRLRQRDGEDVTDIGHIIDRLSLVLDMARQEAARVQQAEAERDAARAEVAALRERVEANPFVTISTALDSKAPDLAGTELQMWRRVTKVCEESGEVWRALSGYVAENPRKGQTHSLDDLRGELLDTASAALCAWAHLNGNEGDPVGALLTHAAGTADRIRAALTRGGEQP